MAVQVFKEMHRVLKPGGTAIMSFSNRCFPTKGTEWALGAQLKVFGEAGEAKYVVHLRTWVLDRCCGKKWTARRTGFPSREREACNSCSWGVGCYAVAWIATDWYRTDA